MPRLEKRMEIKVKEINAQLKGGSSFCYYAYVLRISGYLGFLRNFPPKGNGQNYCTQTGPTTLQKDRWSLHVPPSPTLKDGVLFV